MLLRIRAHQAQSRGKEVLPDALHHFTCIAAYFKKAAEKTD